MVMARWAGCNFVSFCSLRTTKTSISIRHHLGPQPSATTTAAAALVNRIWRMEKKQFILLCNAANHHQTIPDVQLNNKEDGRDQQLVDS